MSPSQQDFLNFRNPRHGSSNPENMTNPFWVWCVRSKGCGYTNNETFNGESSFEVGPCWSFDRFGQTKTELPNGDIVYIAGEHEDGYDPDFHIYNDVIVVKPDGDITIYGYPEKAFPATDFHTATLIDQEIILIGSLGYPDKRTAKQTQVLRLNISDWSITSQKTKNSPGWISSHGATYLSETNCIRITNPKQWNKKHDLFETFATWELNLSTWRWECIEQKNWQQYRLFRKDKQINNLWEIRHHVDMSEIEMNDFDLSDYIDADLDEETRQLLTEGQEEMAREQQELINRTDLSLLPSLYRPSVPHQEIQAPKFTDNDDDDADLEYNHHRIEINGTLIRFIEDSHDIVMRIEGELPHDMVKYILDETCDKLGEFESTKYIWTKLT